MTAALAAARFVHYAACALLFGLSLYRLYARPPLGAGRWLAAAAMVALASGAAWLALVTLNLAGALDVQALASIVGAFLFGKVWLVRLALAALALVLIGRPGASALNAALLLGSIGLTGHTQIHEDGLRLTHEIVDAAHLLAAGAWLGGLTGLLLMLRPGRTGIAADIARFSRMGYLAVATLIATGLLNSWLLVGRPQALLSTPYGRLLSVKLALFAGMLALALINRFQITPRLAGANADAESLRLRRHVLAEQSLGLLVLACVAVLGLGQPPA